MAKNQAEIDIAKDINKNSKKPQTNKKTTNQNPEKPQILSTVGIRKVKKWVCHMVRAGQK